MQKLDEIVWQLLADISLVAIALYDAEKKQLTCVRFNDDCGPGWMPPALPPVPLEPPGAGHAKRGDSYPPAGHHQ